MDVVKRDSLMFMTLLDMTVMSGIKMPMRKVLILYSEQGLKSLKKVRQMRPYIEQQQELKVLSSCSFTEHLSS